jgi:hypothetical protein
MFEFPLDGLTPNTEYRFALRVRDEWGALLGFHDDGGWVLDSEPPMFVFATAP